MYRLENAGPGTGTVGTSTTDPYYWFDPSTLILTFSGTNEFLKDDGNRYSGVISFRMCTTVGNDDICSLFSVEY